MSVFLPGLAITLDPTIDNVACPGKKLKGFTKKTARHSFLASSSMRLEQQKAAPVPSRFLNLLKNSVSPQEKNQEKPGDFFAGLLLKAMGAQGAKTAFARSLAPTLRRPCRGRFRPRCKTMRTRASPRCEPHRAA